VTIASKSAAADTVEQSVYLVEKRNKPALLAHVIAQAGMTRVLVFTRTKRGADKVARHLSREGIRAEAIHGNKSQAVRQRALANFKSRKPPVLVATDVAARGLDIDEVSHVVNYDLPDVPETYVHRIGRTGRAGATGIAVSFCAADEREQLRAIEKLLRKKTPVCDDHPRYSAAPAAPDAGSSGPAKRRSRSNSRKRHAAGTNGNARHDRQAGGAHQRKPHTAGPTDGRQRSRRRHSAAQAARPSGYTTMW
jgi:ATP-dependent RNA helicase RhlE